MTNDELLANLFVEPRDVLLKWLGCHPERSDPWSDAAKVVGPIVLAIAVRCIDLDLVRGHQNRMKESSEQSELVRRDLYRRLAAPRKAAYDRGDADALAAIERRTCAADDLLARRAVPKEPELIAFARRILPGLRANIDCLQRLDLSVMRRADAACVEQTIASLDCDAEKAERILRLAGDESNAARTRAALWGSVDRGLVAANYSDADIAAVLRAASVVFDDPPEIPWPTGVFVDPADLVRDLRRKASRIGVAVSGPTPTRQADKSPRDSQREERRMAISGRKRARRA